MQVLIKVVSSDPQARHGIELDIFDQEDIHMGDLLIDQSRIEWCPGRTPHSRGKKISWTTLIEFLENS